MSAAGQLAQRSSADSPRSFLAFDYGERRVGVATGNTVSASASPLLTIAAQGDSRFEAIARLLAEWQPDALVVGVPFHPDGAPHDNTARARRFANQLRGRFPAYRARVFEVDERYSTTAALEAGAQDADSAAAAILLQQYLDAPAHTHAHP
jgi:putative Holliday junction resolvase